ncbi:hypothetical protein FGO68_gene5720 [Halteria grandinella]|uniref:Uncharacterized protein n=1 Tax=Halteria grandinella TaxID=5974 RepID=A0A8J8NGF1_HALGN|nr:hypothetical protein FGO68_gene5720 [Halteria grandinella]
MLQFSGNICINVLDQENFEVLKSNLDLLCEHLLWALQNLKYKLNYQQTQFFLMIEDLKFSAPFSIQNLSYLENSEEIIDGKLKNFFIFLYQFKHHIVLHFLSIDFSCQ